MNHYFRDRMKAAFWALLFIVVFVALPLWAQTNAATGGAPPPPAVASKGSLAMLLAVLVPLALAGLKQVVPRLPSWTLPILAPALGALGEWLLEVAGKSTLGPGMGALLGSAGVGVRELKDQIHGRIGPVNGTAVMILLLGAFGFLMGGCADLGTNVFRAEQMAAKAADSSMQAYGVLWKSQTNGASPALMTELLQEREQVFDASRKLAEAGHIVEGWRIVYTTNATVKPQLEAAWAGLTSQRSNIVWLVNEFRNKPRFNPIPIHVPVLVVTNTVYVTNAPTPPPAASLRSAAPAEAVPAPFTGAPAKAVPIPLTAGTATSGPAPLVMTSPSYLTNRPGL